MITNNTALSLINSPVRKIGAEVSLAHTDESGSTSTQNFRSTDRLISFTIERIGDETKFFGYGICQKLNFHVLDSNRELNIKAGDIAHVLMYDANYTQSLHSVGSDTPVDFKVTEVHRDENTNELSVTAYDIIYQASNHYYSEVQETFNLTTYDLRPTVYTDDSGAMVVDDPAANISIREYADACITLIGATLVYDDTDATLESAFAITGIPNLEGTETIREVLDDVAEATQTIYFSRGNNEIVFKRLDKSGEAVYEINKSRYFTLDSRTSRRLGKLVSATSLGDNISVETAATGTTQYIRDNAFWDLRADRDTILQAALEVVGGLTINQFDCSWRGNWLLELGDKIGLTTKDNVTVYSYLLNDTVSYDGAYSQTTKWEYTNSDTDEADNPAPLGEALKKTFATVDKVNKEIDIVASLSKENESAIAGLKITTDNITTTVQKNQEITSSALEGMNSDLASLTSKVEAIMTPEMIRFQIQEMLKEGITEVTTTTGYTFNDEGMTVAKSGSEMTTQITEDGMTVYKDNSPMLVANNEGVEAINLNASTYLIIGLNSRFEDYDNKTRTGCFWIGG